MKGYHSFPSLDKISKINSEENWYNTQMTWHFYLLLYLLSRVVSSNWFYPLNLNLFLPIFQMLLSLHPWPCQLLCLLHPLVRRWFSTSLRSTARVCSSTGPHVLAACRTWRRHWPTEPRSTGSTRRTTRGRRSSWRYRGWASLPIIQSAPHYLLNW